MPDMRKKYTLGEIEDILRNAEPEPSEPDRRIELDGMPVIVSGIHVWVPEYRINIHEGILCSKKNGKEKMEKMLALIYSEDGKNLLFDSEDSFVEAVYDWLDGKEPISKLSLEPCEAKGIEQKHCK